MPENKPNKAAPPVDVPRLVRLLRDHEVNPEDLRETIAVIEEAGRFVDNLNRLAWDLRDSPKSLASHVWRWAGVSEAKAEN
jgi:hypothetical protein